jgi:hypothetical protein
MASGQTLPPQAYTREILTSAFNWLQTQPESVRKLATTPDALVGLYTRAKRFGNSSLESDAPVSSQNFISDLKSLAEGIKQFDRPSEEPPITHRPVATSSGPSVGTSLGHSGSHAGKSAAVAAAAMASTGTSGGVMGAGSSVVHSAAATATSNPSATTMTVTVSAPHPGPSAESIVGLNEMSRSMIHEVKTKLNLSSDAEVINMMVALAYKSLKSLLS